MNTIAKIIAGVAIAMSVAPQAARANLALTTAGINDGMSLQTAVEFSSGSTNWGVLGLTVNAGNIVAFDLINGTNYVFPDANNQTLSSALYAPTGFSSNGQYATANGVAYGIDGGLLTAFNANGTVNHQLVTSLTSSSSAGVVALNNGNLLMRTNTGLLVSVNPATNSYTVLDSAFPDGIAGISLSASENKIYAASTTGLTVIDASTGAELINYALPSGTSGYYPYAIGVSAPILTGALADSVIITGLSGQVIDLNLSTGQSTVLANGGLQIAYITQDPTNGSYLIGGSNNIYRLTYSSTTPAPEPGGISVFLLAIALLAAAKKFTSGASRGSFGRL